MKHWLVLVSLLLVPVSGGCSFAGGSTALGLETAEASSRLAVENAEFVVGDTATITEGGNALTVFSYE